MWREKNIYFTEHDIYFTKLMFILKNINLELKSALRTKYIFYRFLLYIFLFIKSRASVLSQDIIFASFPSLLSPQHNNMRESSFQKVGLKNEKEKKKVC